MRMHHFLLANLLLCWLFYVGASAKADISGAQRTEDTRLETPVTLSETRIHVAELLSRLSAQTGVDLKMNARMDASGITLMSSLVHLPLADAMNALASLVGCRSAKWYWERQGKPGHFAYRLQAPQLRETAARLRARVQGEFEREVAMLIKAAYMTPEQRKELMGHSKAEDAAIADVSLMSSIKALSEAVPADMRQRLLRGEITFKLSFSELPPDAQTVARSYYRRQGTTGKDQDPGFVLFNTYTLDAVSPTLSMDIGDNTGSYGYSLAGSIPLDRQLKEELASEWMLPGDTLINALDKQKAAQPENYKPTILPEIDITHVDELPSKVLDEYFARFNSVIQKRLMQMSQAASVSVLAIVPTSQQDAGEPYGKTVGDFVAALRKSDELISKWHGPVQLVSYGRWFLNMDACAPYDTIERLREQQRKGQGIIPLAGLALIADDERLSPGQFASLADDFPVFKNVSDMRGVFILYHRNPGVQAAGGMRLTPELVQIINQPSLVELKSVVQGVRVRVYETLTTTDGKPASTITFDALDSAGRPLGGRLVEQKAPPPAGK